MIEPFPEYVQRPDFHSVVTIQLCELIECGWFDPTADDWKWDAYNDAQYERVCEKFVNRYYFAEISLVPPGVWKREYLRKFNELMPKYKLLYQRLDSGLNPLQSESEYMKRRDIFSEFPQTMLSGNSDYASTGTDTEYDRVKEGNAVDALERFKDAYNDIDVMLLDELNCLFSQLYIVSANGL